MSQASENPTPSGVTTQVNIYEKLRRLPASATTDFEAFQKKGDEEALTRLIIAVLTDHAPDKAKDVTHWSDDTRLLEDLKFDSLSIAETVFFFEDLFQISISNEEIMQVTTLGQLRAFVKQKAKSVSLGNTDAGAGPAAS